MYMRIKKILKDGKVKEEIIDSSEVAKYKLGKVLRNKLPIELELRLQKIWKEIKNYDHCKNYRVFNRDFRREPNPEAEIMWWENFVKTFLVCCNLNDLYPNMTKQKIYNLTLSMAISGLDADDFIALNTNEIPNKVNDILNLNLN
jgi:hypothetical protein